MPWTSDDMKDVLKKTFGTLMASILIIVGAEIYRTGSPLILSLIMAIAAVIILILIWIIGRREKAPEITAVSPPSSKPEISPMEVYSETKFEGKSSQDMIEPSIKKDVVQKPAEKAESSERLAEMEYKLKKKALKTQVKAKKKAEKAKENESE